MRHIILGILTLSFLGCSLLQPTPTEPDATGYIIHREGNTIITDLGSTDGVRHGDELLVFEVESEVHRPVTANLVRVQLRPVGILSLEEVGDISSSGAILSGGEMVQVGQYVRLVPKKRVPVDSWWEEGTRWVSPSQDTDAPLPVATTQTMEQLPRSSVLATPMVPVPAGEFTMGSNYVYECQDPGLREHLIDEAPVHAVYLDTFYIDKYEVTNGQFACFVEQNPEWSKERISPRYNLGGYLDHWVGDSYPPEKKDHPVTYVNWYAAQAYCAWLGRRLPTEAEWEKAARGGLEGRFFPWGDEYDSSQAPRDLADTIPVGQFPPNGYGIYDMASGVREWTVDEYHADFFTRSPYKNPVAGSFTEIRQVRTDRIVRNGACTDNAYYFRVANRANYDPRRASLHLGFRCAKE